MYCPRFSVHSFVTDINYFLQIYDYMFIWKAILIIILIVSLIGGAVLNVGQYWTMKVHGSKPVPRRGSKEIAFDDDDDKNDDDTNY